MATDSSSPILGEPLTSDELDSSEIKHKIDDLAPLQTVEAHDEMIQLAKENGISVTQDMSAEEIQDTVNKVI